MKALNTLFLCLFISLSCGEKDAYRAAVIDGSEKMSIDRITPLIHKAAKSNVDIILLPNLESKLDNYEQVGKKLSNAARHAGLYVVSQLSEIIKCQNKNELIRSNLVFDREGSIIAEYRKPVNDVANCTSDPSELPSFTTDFGITFGVLMEEDIVLRNTEYMKKLTNFVLAGGFASEIPFLDGDRFSSSWAYVHKFNLLSQSAIYDDGNKVEKSSGALHIVDLNKNSAGQFRMPVVKPSRLNAIPREDLSQFIIVPLDLEASKFGFKETVCHNKFCCEFEVKSVFTDSKGNDVNYGLAAFAGVQKYGQKHYIGTENCAIYACAGNYKRSCAIGSENNSTNVVFEKISITGNFTKKYSAQYPFIYSTGNIGNFEMYENVLRTSKQVKIELQNVENLLSFGIFGRDFAKDQERLSLESKEVVTTDIYSYIYSENVLEFFDYLWIRLRILIFVVSIYVLEMM